MLEKIKVSKEIIMLMCDKVGGFISDYYNNRINEKREKRTQLSTTQFERELIALPVKIPIEFESRLVIKTQFLNSFKLDSLLQNIKVSHQSMSSKYPGWIASLL